MKYVIDIPDNTLWIHLIMENTKDHHPYMEQKQVEDLTPYAKPGENEIRQKVEDEVWEFAKKLLNYTDDDWNTIENMLLVNKCSYQEAKAKYDAWQKQKDEICVGDEVVYQGDKYVVGYIGTDKIYHIVDQNWIRVVVQGDYQIFKTGRHFPEVAELLKKMREK